MMLLHGVAALCLATWTLIQEVHGLPTLPVKPPAEKREMSLHVKAEGTVSRDLRGKKLLYRDLPEFPGGNDEEDKLNPKASFDTQEETCSTCRKHCGREICSYFDCAGQETHQWCWACNFKLPDGNTQCNNPAPPGSDTTVENVCADCYNVCKMDSCSYWDCTNPPTANTWYCWDCHNHVDRPLKNTQCPLLNEPGVYSTQPPGAFP
mmetsp:Transcript_44682/g.83311  ORF Transcript_44682/g.83311 Transcript_44682/m.83311 type:complete len:207 (-) Transcript_44682:82-702(-)